MPYSRARVHRRTSFGRKAGGRKTYRRRGYAKSSRGGRLGSTGYGVSTKRRGMSAAVQTGYSGSTKTSKGLIRVPFVSTQLGVYWVPAGTVTIGGVGNPGGVYFALLSNPPSAAYNQFMSTVDIHPVVSYNEGPGIGVNLNGIMGPQIQTIAQGYQHWKVTRLHFRFRSCLPTSKQGIIALGCYPDAVNKQDLLSNYFVPNFNDVSTLNGSVSGPIWAAELCCKGNYGPGMSEGSGKSKNGWFMVDQQPASLATVNTPAQRQNSPCTLMGSITGLPSGDYTAAVSQLGVLEMTGNCYFKDLAAPNLGIQPFVAPTGGQQFTPSSASAAQAEFTETLTDAGTDCTAAAPLGVGNGSFVVTGAPNLVSAMQPTKLFLNVGTFEVAMVWNGATITAAPTATALSNPGYTPAVVTQVLAFYTATQAILNFQIVVSSITSNVGNVSTQGAGVAIGGLTTMTVAGCTIDITQIA